MMLTAAATASRPDRTHGIYLIMKVCIFGAGAIGGHLAARLPAAGADVSVVARGEHLAAIQQNGITLELPDRTLHAWVKIGRAHV